MDTLNNQLAIIPRQEAVSTSKPFIQANTIECSLHDLTHTHIIPVYLKDNEPLISHADFIATTYLLVNDFYAGEKISKPSIRVSHAIKGRIPDAKHKSANELLENEKTLYYERMAFIIEVPSISTSIEGSSLSLTIGGVKAYNLDNLYNKKGADEHFKVFIGFKNTVCTNLCVWTDGFLSDLKVSTIGQLKACIRTMLENYNGNFHFFNLKQLANFTLSEHQFAQLIGRCRLHLFLPPHLRQDIVPLLLGDTQLGMVCKDYYRDESFCRNLDGTINLWKLYNLLTGANKSTYIDSFLDRNVNAYSFVEQIRWALEGKEQSWYLS